MDKKQLVEDVIEQIVMDIVAFGDSTVLEEILNSCSTDVLVNSLPEELGNKYK